MCYPCIPATWCRSKTKCCNCLPYRWSVMAFCFWLAVLLSVVEFLGYFLAGCFFVSCSGCHHSTGVGPGSGAASLPAISSVNRGLAVRDPPPGPHHVQAPAPHLHTHRPAGRPARRVFMSSTSYAIAVSVCVVLCTVYAAYCRVMTGLLSWVYREYIVSLTRTTQRERR